MLPFLRPLVTVTSLGVLSTFWLLFSTHQVFPDGAHGAGGGLTRAEAMSFRQKILARDANDKPWDHVYVVNLATRPDRRDHMNRLASALGIELTFVNGVTKKDPVVPWIVERLHEDYLALSSPSYTSTNSSPEAYRSPPRWGPGGLLSWRAHALSALSPYTTPSSQATKFALSPTPLEGEPLEWPATYLEHYGGRSSDPYGGTACTLSHLKVMELSMRNNDTTMLVLEDDVDAEFGLVDRWREMRRGLEEREEGWDMVYLGHIHSWEGYQKPIFNPSLRRAHSPLGTHAYSLSHRGVRRLHSHLTSTPSLFLRPIDHELAWGVAHHAHYGGLMHAPGTGEKGEGGSEEFQFKVWSSLPPLVAGGDGTLGTDIGGGGGEDWGALLSDSTRRRIAEYEGHPIPPMSDERARDMMAITQGMA